MSERRPIGSMGQRLYPILPASSARPARPLSFVVVHYCDDYFHNILRSDCVRDPFNQLITVDNRNNLFFDNLSEAINAGLDRAVHELMVVVHEDVLFPQGWHRQLERSLADLEKADPQWGMVGAAGWTGDETLVGHWSDPHAYADTLVDTAFAPVERLDEQLMIFRRSSGLRLDALLPSIHNIGRDLASTLRRRGLKTYVIDAPTIHKYADAEGNVIETREDSPKIQARGLRSFIADRACSNEYLYRKWPAWKPDDHEEDMGSPDDLSEELRRRIEQPVVLLSRGGSGSRLLSWLAADAGLFLGNEVNISGDALELVQAVYKGILTKYLRRATWQKQRIVPRIRSAAGRMLERGRPEGLWGFKLPESMLLLPEIDQAFPRARYLHLLRDPLATCLRRTHMTARFDNTIGRVAIPLAYRYCERALTQSLDDSPALHMAYTTIHQIKTVQTFAQTHLRGRYREVSFEDLLDLPQQAVGAVAQWLGTEPQGDKLEAEVDSKRAARPRERYPEDIEEEVARTLAPLRRKLGYL